MWLSPGGLCFLIVFALSAVRADTEIRNFHLPLDSLIPARSTEDIVHVLGASTKQLKLSVSDQDPVLNVLLRGDENHASYTARISWPASIPARFNMTLLPSTADHEAILHISSSPLTPRFPHPLLAPLSGLLGVRSPELDHTHAPRGDYNTTFHLVFEPLVLGVLPTTSVPLVTCIVASGLLAFIASPYLIQFFETWANQSTDESAPSSERAKAE